MSIDKYFRSSSGCNELIIRRKFSLPVKHFTQFTRKINICGYNFLKYQSASIEVAAGHSDAADADFAEFLCALVFLKIASSKFFLPHRRNTKFGKYRKSPSHFCNIEHCEAIIMLGISGKRIKWLALYFVSREINKNCGNNIYLFHKFRTRLFHVLSTSAKHLRGWRDFCSVSLRHCFSQLWNWAPHRVAQCIWKIQSCSFRIFADFDIYRDLWISVWLTHFSSSSIVSSGVYGHTPATIFSWSQSIFSPTNICFMDPACLARVLFVILETENSVSRYVCWLY